MGNPIDVAHEKYLLIDNGGYLTAVKTGAMRHWTEKVNDDVKFVEVPQEIRVPPAGKLARFEKKLVEPSDKLFIRASYVWKGR